VGCHGVWHAEIVFPTNIRWPLGVLLIAVIAAGLVGCSSTPAPAAIVSNPSAASSPNTVHMDNTRFLPDSITISAGESVTLVADTMRPYIIANGTWGPGNRAQPAREPGAPEVRDLNSDELKVTLPPKGLALIEVR